MSLHSLRQPDPQTHYLGVKPSAIGKNHFQEMNTGPTDCVWCDTGCTFTCNAGQRTPGPCKLPWAHCIRLHWRTAKVCALHHRWCHLFRARLWRRLILPCTVSNRRSAASSFDSLSHCLPHQPCNFKRFHYSCMVILQCAHYRGRFHVSSLIKLPLWWLTEK